MTKRDVLYDAVIVLVNMAFNPRFRGENIFYLQLEDGPSYKESQEKVDMPNKKLGDSLFKLELSKNIVTIMNAAGNYFGDVTRFVYDLLSDAKNNELIEIVKVNEGYRLLSDCDSLFVKESFPPILFYLSEFSLEELAEK